jgi:hypothetical protein
MLVQPRAGFLYARTKTSYKNGINTKSSTNDRSEKYKVPVNKPSPGAGAFGFEDATAAPAAA